MAEQENVGRPGATLAATAHSPIGYFVGALCGVGAVLIWGGWMAVTRLGVTTTLSAADLTMLRFGVAGLILLPVVLRHGLALDKLGWPGLIILVSGSGAPYAFVMSTGLGFAPAAEAGVVLPGAMPIFVALLSVIFFRERFTRSRLFGYVLIVVGAGSLIALTIIASDADNRSWGHGLFVSAAFMWACYTIVLRKSKLPALHAAALVSVGSGIVYLPFYLAIGGAGLLDAPIRDLVIQGIYQGVFATVLSLFLFGRAVSIFGASAGAAFAALLPLTTALLAILLLSEYPTPTVWIGILLMTAGVYLASGGRLTAKTGHAVGSRTAG